MSSHSPILGRTQSHLLLKPPLGPEEMFLFPHARHGAVQFSLPELRVLPTGRIRVCENQGVKLLGIAAVPLDAGGAMLDLQGCSAALAPSPLSAPAHRASRTCAGSDTRGVQGHSCQLALGLLS